MAVVGGDVARGEVVERVAVETALVGPGRGKEIGTREATEKALVVSAMTRAGEAMVADRLAAGMRAEVKLVVVAMVVAVTAM